MYDLFEKKLKQRKENNLYREIKLPHSIEADFTSNDYLGLSFHPLIRKKMISALEGGLPLSSKASRILGGNSSFHMQAEEALKKFIDRPAVLSFSSGYQTNIGVIPALAKGRVIFSDELNHASLIDGIRLSSSPYYIFRHNDLNQLEDLLKKAGSVQKLIITESLFSMKGDFSPLEELSDLALKHQALLIIDEAHSTGLFGKNLGGRVSDLKQKDHIVTIHTGGKALASSGAFVGSSLLIKNYLVNYCRSFIYSTSPSPLLMVQWLACLEVLKKESFRAFKLKEKSFQFKNELSQSLSSNVKASQICKTNLNNNSFFVEKEKSQKNSITDCESPIFFIVLKDAEEALRVSQKLREHNFFVQAVRSPTVPKDQQGIRLVFHYDHTTEQLEGLKEYLFKLLKA